MKNVFVATKNVRNFISTMRESEAATGEPALLLFHGQAGRGKTTAAQYYAAQEGWTYCRALKGWTELWMLQDICFELRIDPIPKRKKPAMEAIVERLRLVSKPVLIDEADKLSDGLLEWIRDLADLSFVPFALIGEKLLMHKMQRERRVWSRTLQSMEFGPVPTEDVLFFAKQAADLLLTADQGEKLRAASDGDFRLVARDVRRLEQICSANDGKKITDDMVSLAIKQGLRGR